MIKGLKVLAVVPARGGSKGIVLKNLKKVNGSSLVTLVGEVITDVVEIDTAVISTDHQKIASVATDAGIRVPFFRPEALSGDRVSDLEVLTHALLETELVDKITYDIIVMLQPTSPLRKATHISETIQMLVNGKWDSVWTVSETDSKSHPLKQLVIDDKGLNYYDEIGSKVIARQELSPVYHRNGIAYAITRECLMSQKSIKGKKTGALIIPGQHVSIDNEWDLFLVNILSNENKS
jgi:CMP-N,N'-diacetyllegionaminic acid synthase